MRRILSFVWTMLLLAGCLYVLYLIGLDSHELSLALWVVAAANLLGWLEGRLWRD